jgi:hypothetical protein
MTEVQLKLLFAAELLKVGNAPNEAFRAAIVIFPDDTSLALRAATNWVTDPIVIAEKARLSKDYDEEDYLPSKHDLLREIHDKAKAAVFSEDYARLMRLYMEVRGMIAKPQPNTNVNIIQNKVMVVRDHGTDDNWKAGVKAQQTRLINAGSSSTAENGYSMDSDTRI